jgi:hypothetical protein
VAKIALLIRVLRCARLPLRPQGDDGESSLYHWRLMNPTREVHPFHIHQVPSWFIASEEIERITHYGNRL